MQQKNKRIFSILTKDLRINASGDIFFTGYASVFNVADRNGEVVMAGAFAKSLAEISGNFNEIKLLWQHDLEKPIGKITKITEDAYGLYIEGLILSALSEGENIYLLLQNQIINGLSIGYTVSRSRKGSGVIYLDEINLLEVSLVTIPANEFATLTSVQMQQSVVNSVYSDLGFGMVAAMPESSVSGITQTIDNSALPKSSLSSSDQSALGIAQDVSRHSGVNSAIYSPSTQFANASPAVDVVAELERIAIRLSDLIAMWPTA